MPGGSLTLVIFLTNSAEFLHWNGELHMRREMILMRKDARFSCGAPMCDVITRAGKFLTGLWALMVTDADGVTEPEG